MQLEVECYDEGNYDHIIKRGEIDTTSMRICNPICKQRTYENRWKITRRSLTDQEFNRPLFQFLSLLSKERMAIATTWQSIASKGCNTRSIFNQFSQYSLKYTLNLNVHLFGRVEGLHGHQQCLVQVVWHLKQAYFIPVTLRFSSSPHFLNLFLGVSRYAQIANTTQKLRPVWMPVLLFKYLFSKLWRVGDYL